MDVIGPSQTLSVDGLTIFLCRKRVRNVNLRVTRDCRVCVSAPQHVPTSRIETFVRDRRPWIERQLARQASLDAALSARTFSPGEKTYVWGTPYDLRLIRDDSLRKVRASIRADACVEIVGPGTMLDDSTASIDARRDALREMRLRLMRDELDTIRDEAQGITGLVAAEWRLRRMTSRWGSCSVARRRIWLSTELAKYPRECASYVAIHELCHLVEANHGTRFHALQERYCPDWRKLKAILDGGSRSGI